MTIEIVIIRGAPGVGKSTLGRGLLGALDRGAVVEVDAVRSMIARVDWSDVRAHHQAMWASFAAAESFLGDGVRPVFMLDTWGGSILTGPLGRAFGSGRRFAVWSLWADEPALQERLERRRDGWKDWPSTRHVNTEIRRHRFPQDTVIDVTNLTPDQVLQTCLDLLRREGLHSDAAAAGLERGTLSS